MNKFLSFLFLLVFITSPAAVEFSAEERSLIALHGPWPPVTSNDSSNRVSGNLDAIQLGQSLFFDQDLGGDTKLSCSSCHVPNQAFTDRLDTGRGRFHLSRNTTSLYNLKGNRWYGWGGESDSLWAQSIRPILASEEMSRTPSQVKYLMLSKTDYRSRYRSVFGVGPGQHTSEQVLVNVGKALAAFQETLITPRTAFDEFRDALLRNDLKAMQNYPESAKRGLKLFVGEARCNLCHFGPKFSNGEFDNVGITYFTVDGVDPGRYQGIRDMQQNPYNRLGMFNDGNAELNALATRHIHLQQRNWGEFKVPGLRSVASTAPYMHNGSLPTLQQVILHYSKIDEGRLHSHGEKVLRPLNLNDQQVEDLRAFLVSLGEH